MTEKQVIPEAAISPADLEPSAHQEPHENTADVSAAVKTSHDEVLRASTQTTTIEINGEHYEVEFLKIDDPECDKKLHEFYEFMARPGHIDPNELADESTFKRVLETSETALQMLQEKQYEQLTPKKQPYFILTIRDPKDHKVIAGLSGAMILGDITPTTPANEIPATFMLSYTAVDASRRGANLTSRMTGLTIDHFKDQGLQVKDVLTEAVDSAEKSINKINGTSRLYAKKTTTDGQEQWHQIIYLMPSQEYDLDGNPTQKATDTSNLMMSFMGKEFQRGVPGRIVKDRIRRMWNWVYRRDVPYFKAKQEEAGIPFDEVRAAEAMKRTSEYVDNLEKTMFAQFSDEELLYPKTNTERMKSPEKFIRTRLQG